MRPADSPAMPRGRNVTVVPGGASPARSIAYNTRMNRLFDKSIVLACCIAAAMGLAVDARLVAAFCLGVIATSLAEVAQDERTRRASEAASYVYIIAGVFIPPFVPFAPLALYDIARRVRREHAWTALGIGVAFVFALVADLRADALTARTLLLAAILSDTLVFRSPTCTPVDVNAANRLAKIAGVDINEFANEMFEAGEKLDGKTAEEVFLQDFKVFMCGDIRFGVAQGSYMTRKNLTAAEALLKPYLEEARNKQNVEDIYMLLTDVPKEESVVICNGRYAAEVLTDGFDTQPAADASWTLPGVVSRKKQFIPALMTAYQEL